MDMMDIVIPAGSGANMELPDPGLLNYFTDLERRTIWIDFEIDSTLLEVSRKIIQWNYDDRDIKVDDRIPIFLMIFSPGGDLDATMHCVDIIRLSKTPVVTVNTGIAMSGGMNLLIAGHRRLCLPHARGMIHTGSGGLSGTFDQVSAAADDYKVQISEMKDYILTRTNIDPRTYSKKKNKDWYLNSAEMVKYGIVDEVVDDISKIYM